MNLPKSKIVYPIVYAYWRNGIGFTTSADHGHPQAGDAVFRRRSGPGALSHCQSVVSDCKLHPIAMRAALAESVIMVARSLTITIVTRRIG